MFLLCKHIEHTEHTEKWLMRQWRRKPGKKCGNGRSWRYTLVCLTRLPVPLNLLGDTWAIAKCPTIRHYWSPIFLHHFSAHIDIDNDFAQQIPNPWVIVFSVRQTGLYNLKKGNGEENTSRQTTKDTNPQQLKIQMILLTVALLSVKSNSSWELWTYDSIRNFLLLPTLSV